MCAAQHLPVTKSFSSRRAPMKLEPISEDGTAHLWSGDRLLERRSTTQSGRTQPRHRQLIYSLQWLPARPDGETGRRTGLKKYGAACAARHFPCSYKHLDGRVIPADEPYRAVQNLTPTLKPTLRGNMKQGTGRQPPSGQHQRTPECRSRQAGTCGGAVHHAERQSGLSRSDQRQNCVRDHTGRLADPEDCVVVWVLRRSMSVIGIFQQQRFRDTANSTAFIDG